MKMAVAPVRLFKERWSCLILPNCHQSVTCFPDNSYPVVFVLYVQSCIFIVLPCDIQIRMNVPSSHLSVPLSVLSVPIPMVASSAVPTRGVTRDTNPTMRVRPVWVSKRLETRDNTCNHEGKKNIPAVMLLLVFTY